MENHFKNMKIYREIDLIQPDEPAQIQTSQSPTKPAGEHASEQYRKEMKSARRQTRKYRISFSMQEHTCQSVKSAPQNRGRKRTVIVAFKIHITPCFRIQVIYRELPFANDKVISHHHACHRTKHAAN